MLTTFTLRNLIKKNNTHYYKRVKYYNRTYFTSSEKILKYILYNDRRVFQSLRYIIV